MSRRLELLGAELETSSPEPTHTRIRPARPAPLDRAGADQQAVPQAAPETPPGIPRPGRHAARRARGNRLVDGSVLGGRVALGPAQLAVVAVLVAVGLAVTAWWVLRDDPGSLVPAAPDTTTGVPLVQGSSPASAAATGGDLIVEVAGKVRRPGIVELPPGSRVVDAIEAAGGARRGVGTRSLNLARPLVDGEQILVGVRPVPGTAASSAAAPSATSPAELVNLNTATQAELEELPGVGPVTAEAILAWRTEHGGFSSVDQLLEVDGIGEATLADLAPLVTL